MSVVQAMGISIRRKDVDLQILMTTIKEGAHYVQINGEYVSAGKARSDAAKGISKPVAGLVRAEPQHREVQTLANRSQKQNRCKKGVVVCRILIIRYGRKILDDDNLAASYKGLRDNIAAMLRVDDGDPRIKFDYAQVTTKGATGTHVLISQ